MLAFIFPGQGSQYPGMGEDFYKEFPSLRMLYEEASDVLGIDMKELCFRSPVDELGKTANAQPAILLTSISMLEALKQECGVQPQMLAGHSLGEYTALVASGAIGLSDALHIVRKRGEFMQDAVPLGIGSMAAVIGMDSSQIEKICDTVSGESGVVQPANYNSELQTVISGHRNAVEQVCEKARQSGAKRVVPLNVSAPFHCELMSEAADKLKEVLDRITVKAFKIPVVTNVYARINEDSEKVTAILYEQMTKPVRWTESVKYMHNNNIDKFLEIGPGNVLTGLIKRTVKGALLSNLEKTDHLNHIKENGI